MFRRPNFRGWMNRIFMPVVGGAQRPVVFDIEKTFPALLQLDKNFSVIQSELTALLAERDTMPRYHDIDPNQNYISRSTPRRWSVFMLYFLDEDFSTNQARCPRTSEILARIPDLFQCFVSILEAGKSVPAHGGPYLGYLRYHLGIKVPANNPPSIRVKDHTHIWQEGESILFDDSWEHEVFNESNDDRMVLIVDVLRPMPWYASWINRLFTATFAKRYARRVRQIADSFAAADPDS